MTEQKIKEVIEDILKSNETVGGVSTEVKNELIGIGYALLERHGLPEEAIELFSKIIDIDPNFVGAIHWRGIAKSKAGKHEEAIADFDKELAILGIDSVSSAAHCHKGKALVNLGRLEEAVASFTNAINLYPEHENYFVYRGEALFCLKRYEEALADYTKAIAIEPEEPELYLKRSAKFREIGRSVESKRDLEKANELKRQEESKNNDEKKILESLLSEDTKELYHEIGLDEDTINSLIESDKKTLDGLEKKIIIETKKRRWHDYLFNASDSWYGGAVVGAASGGLISLGILLASESRAQSSAHDAGLTIGAISGGIWGLCLRNHYKNDCEEKYAGLVGGLSGGLICGFSTGLGVGTYYEHLLGEKWGPFCTIVDWVGGLLVAGLSFIFFNISCNSVAESILKRKND